ncbi:MAG: bifunctional hydroxymethylpyrimidine kinase/phosphomethylpyrimidine kinase [Actinomycetota bacterium]
MSKAGEGSLPVALTVAGSDSSGGAGIQADLKTFMALGVDGLSAVTALTAQSVRGISDTHRVPPAFVRRQIREVATNTKIGAVKTGMLASSATIEEVAEAFGELGLDQVVVDPVVAATTGQRLLDPEAIGVMVKWMFPLALVVTPNLSEASALTGFDVSTPEDMDRAARQIYDFGPQFVLIKGGHLAGDPTDVLFDGSEITHLGGQRIYSQHTHGTGCKLSAAITACLALGQDVPSAVMQAKAFVNWVLRNGFPWPGEQPWKL